MGKEYSQVAKIVWSKLSHTECQIEGKNTTLIEIKDVWKMIEEIENVINPLRAISHFVYKNASNENVVINLMEEIEFKLVGGIIHFYYTFKRSWTNADDKVEIFPVFNNTNYFWCIETMINNQAHWWTGNIPHLSIRESEQGLEMWTTNIHNSKQFPTSQLAENYNKDFCLLGAITDHIVGPI